MPTLSTLRALRRVAALSSLVLLAGCSLGSTPPARFPGQEWAHLPAAEAGLDPARLASFARAVGGDGVVVRHGAVVESWGDPTRRADWASAAKPVLSTLLFFAVDEGLLEGVDERVRPWVRRRWPGKDLVEKDRSMTFSHLANMTSGYARGEPPGTHFAYNDFGVELFWNLLAEVFGTSLDAAAMERLAPLELQDGGLFGSRGGGGVDASPRDFARIALLWLRRGEWKGEPLLPRRFFEEYVRPQIPPDMPVSTEPGEDYLGLGSYGGGSNQLVGRVGLGTYGFSWWFNHRSAPLGEPLVPELPRDSFQAIGHWGREVVVVVPSLELVVAARGHWGGGRLANAGLLMEAVVDEGRAPRAGAIAPPARGSRPAREAPAPRPASRAEADGTGRKP